MKVVKYTTTDSRGRIISTSAVYMPSISIETCFNDEEEVLFIKTAGLPSRPVVSTPMTTSSLLKEINTANTIARIHARAIIPVIV